MTFLMENWWNVLLVITDEFFGRKFQILSYAVKVDVKFEMIWIWDFQWVPALKKTLMEKKASDPHWFAFHHLFFF